MPVGSLRVWLQFIVESANLTKLSQVQEAGHVCIRVHEEQQLHKPLAKRSPLGHSQAAVTCVVCFTQATKVTCVVCFTQAAKVTCVVCFWDVYYNTWETVSVEVYC